MRHPHPKQLGDLMLRVGVHMADRGDDFLSASRGWAGARGYPSIASGTPGGGSTCNCGEDASGATMPCPHGSSTERAALANPDLLCDAHDRMTRLMRVTFHQLAEIENLLHLLHQPDNEGRGNDTESCAKCGKVITRVGDDRPRMVDGEPHCPACYKRQKRAA